MSRVKVMRALGRYTALKVANVVRSLNVVACPRNGRIPELSRRRTLQQNQNRLVNIDDYVADSNEVEKPGGFLPDRVAFLYPQ